MTENDIILLDALDDEVQHDFNTIYSSDKYDIPEKRLVIAVLEDAVDRYKNREEELDWFLSKSKKPWSINWICDILDLNKSYLLKGLKNTKRAEVINKNR